MTDVVVRFEDADGDGDREVVVENSYLRAVLRFPEHQGEALENNGDQTIASDWDIHSFHRSGEPPHSSWLLAPKRAWVSCGQTRMRTIVKEASPIFTTLDIDTYVADLIEWDLDEPGWWYALGPGDGEEFYLLRGRQEFRKSGGGLWSHHRPGRGEARGNGWRARFQRAAGLSEGPSAGSGGRVSARRRTGGLG